jgi:hypothetical protein
MKTKIKKAEVIMKTMRIAMIATFVALAIASLANAGDIKAKPTKKVVDVTFEQAVQLPGLVVAMYQQLNSEFLNDEEPVYTVKVDHGGVTFRITGTRDQWVLFFRLNWKYVYDFKKLEIDN